MVGGRGWGARRVRGAPRAGRCAGPGAIPGTIPTLMWTFALREGSEPPEYTAPTGHGEAPFECHMPIEGEAVARNGAQGELALWTHMVALEVGETELTGEAGTYAKRLRRPRHGTGTG